MLRGTGALVGMLVIDGLLTLLAPSTMRAVELKALSRAEGNMLPQMGRVLSPHVRLPDAAHALLVKDLDTKAAQDAQTATQLHEGIVTFDKLAGDSFIKASAKRRLVAVKAIGGKPFFNTARGQCVTSLYDGEMASAMFSCPGSAWEKGGYITRGLQDLKWLSTPPVEASLLPFLG